MRYLFIAILISSAWQGDAQQQGICGKILWVEGNQMPGPGRKPDAGRGVEREIHIYEITTLQQVTPQNGFYKNPQTTLVAIGKSKRNGSFKIKLPPGKYSIFVKEPQGLFANLFGHNGSINPVNVNAGAFTIVDIMVNYKAAY